MDSARSIFLKKSVETVVLPLLALWALYLWPAALFHYPWWWLAPLATSLRYGLTFGMAAALVLVIGNFMEIWLLGVPRTQPGGEIVGGLVATYLGGLYTSHAQSRLEETSSTLEYLEQRLESLTRIFYVTRLSHARLEESLITKSNDLRSGLDAVANALAACGPLDDELPRRPLQHILQLLAFYGRLGQAGVFRVAQGRVSREAVAFHGEEFSLQVDDPLVTGVLENEQLAYYSVDQIIAGEESAYRVVIPMVAADGTLLALVVVVELPLLAVEEENLLTLAAMTAFTADALRAAQLSHAVRSIVPACPVEFALEWHRLGHLRRRAQVRSSWVRLTPAAGAEGGVLDLIQSVRRGLDQYWCFPLDGGRSGLLVLLVLAGEGATRGFMQRIDALCQERFGRALQQLDWRARHGQILYGSGQELQQLLAGSGSDGHD